MNTCEYLEHHGILGQRWGVRRFQNPDGSLTKAGQKRYGTEGSRTAKQTQNRLNDVQKAIAYNKRDLRNKEETISTFKDKKGSNDFQKGVLKDRDAIKKRISDGDKEITDILKKSGRYEITSKDIKQNTTPGAVRTYQTLAIVGSIPFGLLPGPNLPLIAAISYKSATDGANAVSSKKYKVEESIAPYYMSKMSSKQASNALSKVSDKELNKMMNDTKNAQSLFAERAKPKPGNASLVYDETMETFNKAIKQYNKEIDRRSKTATNKVDKNQSENARRNAAEQLRYGEGKKSRQLAVKEISKMNDKDLKSEIKNWRESAEYHRKNGDNDTARQWEQNAKLYENELNKRRL